jgi:hypothetical protein
MTLHRTLSALVTLLGLVAGANAASADPDVHPVQLGLSSITGGMQTDPLAQNEGGYASPAYITTPPGYHQHDGFFLRILVGPSAVAASANDAAETSVSGTGGAFGLAMGVALMPNVILYGEVFDSVAIGPTVESGAFEVETSDDTAFSIVGIGPGMAIYFPSNFYLSGTLAFSRLVADPDTGEDDDEATSDLGIGLSATLGKEWWVSTNWGLGAALQLYAGGMKDGGAETEDGDDVTWGAASLLLAFSATLN